MQDLRTLRRCRGLTLEAVGYMARVDQATVSRIERGLVEPMPETVVRLARGYGISIRRLERMLQNDKRQPHQAGAVKNGGPSPRVPI